MMTIQSSGMLCRIVWQMAISVLEEPAVSIFQPDNGSSSCLETSVSMYHNMQCYSSIGCNLHTQCCGKIKYQVHQKTQLLPDVKYVQTHSVDWRTILKRIYRNMICKGVDKIQFVQDSIQCENGSEYLDSIKWNSVPAELL